MYMYKEFTVNYPLYSLYSLYSLKFLKINIHQIEKETKQNYTFYFKSMKERIVHSLYPMIE